MMLHGRTPRLACAALLVFAFLATQALAAPDQISLPTSGKPSVDNSLRLTIEGDFRNDYGYAPFLFKFTAPTASTADRALTVRLVFEGAEGSGDSEFQVSVEKDVDFPAGATSVELEIMSPQLTPWRLVRNLVWVDGVLDPELKGGMTSTPRSPEFSLEFYEPAAHSKPLRQRVIGFPGEEDGEQLLVVEGGLPSDWRSLSCYDGVRLSATRLFVLADSDESSFENLKRWVRCGGMLVVDEVGDKLDRLPQIEKLLGYNTEPFNLRDAREMRDIDLLRTWKEQGEDDEQLPNDTKQSPPNPDAPEWTWTPLWFVEGRTGGQAESNRPGERRYGGRRERLVSREGWFVERPLGFGVVVAFPKGFMSQPDPSYDGQAESYRARTRYFYQHDWRRRYGITPDAGNHEFSNWLVPGVGAAPVDAFRWLITLFVVLVGPVSYLALRFAQRSHLLVLTAPIMAVLFTGGLYAYATLSDGFGTRVRARSLTFLDQRTGDATSWSRQSYYTGLAPAEGMTFPPSAAVYPVLPAWGERQGRSHKARVLEVEFDETAQRLAEGWLSSRTTTQVLVVDSGACQARLNVDDSGDAPSVTNQLGATIEALFVIDLQGEWWAGLNLAPGEKARLHSTRRSSAVTKVRDLLAEAAPEFPQGLEPGAARRNVRGRYPPRAYDGSSPNASPFNLGENRLEQVIGQVGGIKSGLPLPIGKGAYIALSRESVASPIGVEGAREDGSIHLTLGRWAP